VILPIFTDHSHPCTYNLDFHPGQHPQLVIMSDTYHATQENTNLTAGFPARTNGDPLEKDFSNGHNGISIVHPSFCDK
jgi:hypothetical protein